jgi:DNA-binding XRE family transcriptional regulator
MPTAPDNHDAHDYAERIRERLRRRLQELRERCGLSKYGLARESGIIREYIGKLEAMRRLSRSFTKKNTLGCGSNMSRNACGSAMLAKKALWMDLRAMAG